MRRLTAFALALDFTLALLAPAAGPPPKGVQVAEVLRRAEKAAARIEDPKDRAMALAGVGLAYHKSGAKAAADLALKLALTTAETIEEDTPLSFALEAIAGAQAQRGNVAAALKACGVMENQHQRASLIQNVISELAGAGHIEAARKLALDRKDHRRDEALVAVAKAEAKAGKVAEARKTVKGLSNPFSRWGPLYEVAKAHARANQPEEVKQALAEVRGIIDRHIDPKNLPSWLIGHATVQVECGDVQGALKTLEAVQALEKKVKAPEPDWASAWKLATELAWNGHPKEALALTEKTEKLPAAAKAGVLFLVARSQALVNDRAGARATFAKAKKLADPLPDGLEKDWMQITIAEVQMRMGDAKGALATARAMKNVSARNRAFFRVGVAQRATDRAAAAKVFAEVAGEMVDPKAPGRVLLPMFMRQLAEAGGSADGLAILEKEKSPTLKARGLTLLSEGMMQARQEAKKP